MTINPSFFIDAFTAHDQESKKKFIDLYRQLFFFAKYPKHFRIFLPAETVQSLVVTGNYPFENNLEHILREEIAEGVYTLQDFISSFHNIMEKAETNFQHLGFKDLIAENVEVDGADLSHIPIDAREAEQKNIVAVALNQLGIISNSIQCLTLLPLKSAAVPVKGELSLIDSDEALSVQFSTPFSFFGPVQNFASGMHFEEVLNPEKIWETADCDDDIYFAVHVLSSQFLKGSGCQNPIENKTTFSIGSEFFSSLENHQAIRTGRFSKLTLTFISRLVANLGNINCDPFRTSKKPNAEQVVRNSDAATAWRCHLTKSHEGLRLMFWKLPNGSIELANVGTKFEEKIV